MWQCQLPAQSESLAEIDRQRDRFQASMALPIISSTMGEVDLSFNPHEQRQDRAVLVAVSKSKDSTSCMAEI